MKADSSIKQRCKQRYRLRQFQGTPRSQHNNNSNSSRNNSRDLSTSTDVILSPMVSSVSQLTPLSQKENTTLLSLPAELITRISYNLTLPEYSRFSRTCKYLGNHFQKELILFLRYVYGLSVKSGSLVLYAYGAHLQYRAPKLLDRILDEFFVDANDTPNSGPNNNNKASPTSRQTNSRWPTYWSVLYSLDKAPNIDPPVINTNTSGIGSCCNECYFQPNQNMPCYKCASTQYQGSELMTNPNPKLQFLQKYAARMNAKFAGRSGRSVSGERSHNNGRRNEWLITDVRLKKTYNMLIMQNIRYGDVTLLRFYLDKYGAPINAQVTFSQEEQVYLGADSELMKLLDEYRIRVVLTP